MGASCDEVEVAGTVLALVFFLAEALVEGDAGVAGVDSADFNSGVTGGGSSVEAGVEAGSCSCFGFLAGEAGLFSPPFEVFFFLLITSVQFSSVLG